MVYINTFELMELAKVVQVTLMSKMIIEVAKHQNVRTVENLSNAELVVKILANKSGF